MPWTRTPEDIEQASGYMDALRSKPEHHIDTSAYVSPEAHVHTEALKIGPESWVAGQAILRGDITMGEQCTINAMASLSGKITMGNGVRVASLTTIVGFNHRFDDLEKPIYQQAHTCKGIEIGDDVWIGANVVICDGVKVGSHSVIAAGAVVVKDVAEYSIVGGNPARLIRDRRVSKQRRSTNVEQTLIDLNAQITEQWQNVLRNYEAKYKGEPIYLDPQYGQPTLRAWCDAIEIAGGFGETPSLESREALIHRLKSYQEAKYGLIFSDNKEPPPADKLIHLPDGYHFLAVGYALECLGSNLPNEIKAIDKLEYDEVEAHLESLNWKDAAWDAGSWVDHYGTGMYHNLRHHHSSVRPDHLFAWLDRNCDPATGMWGAQTREQQWLQAVNGFYRLTRGTYAQFGRELPYPESSIDTILSHCRLNGNFLEHNINACNVLDIVHPLWLCSKQSPHRKSEIQEIIEIQLLAIAPRWQKNYGFSFAPGMPAGLQGTEMWLSVVAIAANYLGLEDHISFKPQGVHRLAATYPLPSTDS